METKQLQEEEKSLDLIPLLKALLSKIWLMVILGLIFGSLAFGATKLLIKPVYRCGFTAYVNNQQAHVDKSSVTNSDLVAAQQLTKTYSYIMRSNRILSASLESIHSDLSYKALNGMMSTEIKDGTELISVYVVNEDPDLAYRLASAVADTAPQYMSEIVEGTSMRIVDYPEPTTTRYGPSYFKYAMLGGIVGALLIVLKVIIDFFRDDRVKNEQQIEERFDIPILGIIPDGAVAGEDKNGQYYSAYGNGKNNSEGVEGV